MAEGVLRYHLPERGLYSTNKLGESFNESTSFACSRRRGSGATRPMAAVPRVTPRPRRRARSPVRLRHLRLGHHREQPLGHLLLDEAHRVLVRVSVRVRVRVRGRVSVRVRIRVRVRVRVGVGVGVGVG